MTKHVAPEPGETALLNREGLDRLIRELRADGFAVIGPVAADGAVVYREIEAAGALPAGWGSEQAAGRYRLVRREDDALFGYVAGAQSWKPYLFQSSRRLWKAERTADGFAVREENAPAPRYAFLGVRACELAGIELQDKVFLDGEAPDPDYAARRREAFVIAVQCGEAGETCFCASMGTGPSVKAGYDLRLTELLSGERHVFLLEAGSERGAAIAARLPLQPAADSDRTEAAAAVAQAESQMGRTLETAGLKDLIQQNQEHPHWDDVAERCLACANCTAVCPTCFCHTVEDTTDLEGLRAERHQRWDSCFSLDFSHLTHGPVRSGVKARYRQWMSHKLAHWVDQFGESGCVGCGRCVTWCPAGIDITAEAAALRQAVEGGD